jgi:hypothetical protein
LAGGRAERRDLLRWSTQIADALHSAHQVM